MGVRALAGGGDAAAICGEGLGLDACTACYEVLRPNEAVATRVAANLRCLHADFVSLHVRRTDHWGSEATDEDYGAFIDKHASGKGTIG